MYKISVLAETRKVHIFVWQVGRPGPGGTRFLVRQRIEVKRVGLVETAL